MSVFTITRPQFTYQASARNAIQNISFYKEERAQSTGRMAADGEVLEQRFGELMGLYRQACYRELRDGVTRHVPASGHRGNSS